MRHKSGFATAFFVLLLLLFAAQLTLRAQGNSQELEFEVLASGDISGYTEETYLIARTEDEWTEIWKNHSAPILEPEQWIEFWENRTGSIPSTFENWEINFSQKMVICAFMGERHTAGYSITVGRVWVEDELIHVEIAKSNPSDGLVVPQVLTYPYVFASFERREMDVIFEVTEEDGTLVEYVLPEISSAAYFLAAFLTLSALVVVLVRCPRARVFAET